MTDSETKPEDLASSKFNEYRSRNPSRDPDLSLQRFSDETDLINTEEGLSFLIPAPIETAQIGSIPRSRNDGQDTKYLWVVGKTLIPYALENGENRGQLQRGRLAHTNLTGGSPAHSGGEMWFLNAKTIIINGGSSRYLVRDIGELLMVAKSFKDCGFAVACMGYDPGTGQFARTLRNGEEPTWL